MTEPYYVLGQNEGTDTILTRGQAKRCGHCYTEDSPHV